MFPVKHTVIYTFFCYNVSPKHLFLQCFQCSGIQKPCKILLCTMFFSFLAVFPLPESYQNDPKFHFNTLLRSDTQKSSKNVENTTVFWSRCETVFGVWSRCETVFGPPPPAKADIATAILTNVIEHLVLLLPPNKHAFTAKAVWADLLWKQVEPRFCWSTHRSNCIQTFRCPVPATRQKSCGNGRPSPFLNCWTGH